MIEKQQKEMEQLMQEAQEVMEEKVEDDPVEAKEK